MKTIIGLLFIVILSICSFYFFNPSATASIKTESEKGEQEEEYSKWIEEETKLMADPSTGKIPEGIREAELAQAKQVLQDQINRGINGRTGLMTYDFQGPSNLGGRTREIAFDVSDVTNNTILAGSVSGGLFKTTNGGASWTRTNPNDQLFTVTALAQDTRVGQRNVWYYGGGEATGNSAAETGAFFAGHGVFKSTDNGNSWSRLTNSNTGNVYSFDSRADFINKIAVNPVNGDVYVACAGQILRSQNQGTTWSAVFTSSSFTSSDQYTDVAITTTGLVYVAFSGTTHNGAGVDGVWSSSTGNSGSFTHLAGTGAATSPAGWNAYGNYGRVVLAIAPSNENVVYALYYNNVTSSCAGIPIPEADLFLWNDFTGTWTDLSATMPDEVGCLDNNDPFGVQGGYDLVINVKPDDENTIFVGGTNAYRSNDGGFTWTRIGGYASPANFLRYTNHHSDIHVLKFSPGNTNIIYSGDDGGIQKGDITATPVVWTSLNNDYRTYQFYHVGIKPENGSQIFIGGAQDNGSVTANSSTSMTRCYSGDGVAVGLASGASPYKEYTGSQLGSIRRRNNLQAENVVEAVLSPTGVTSIFVTYFLLDPDNSEYLYYAGQVSGSNKLLRITNASTAFASSWQTFTFNFTGYIRSMATTRGSYTASSKLYMGTSSAKVYRLDDPVNAATGTTPVDITPSGITAGSTVIWIAVNPADDNQVMCVCSNYGANSVFFTSNAGSATPTWTNVEGNLSLPSYRSCIIANVGGVPEYFVGTSIGLYHTSTLNGASTVWSQESPTDIGNSMITSLALRPSDNVFVIGTHGSGMYKGSVSIVPVKLTSFTGSLVHNNALLKWITAQEANNRGFDIERSYDQLVFKRIGFVNGAGNSNNAKSYNFKDPEAAHEINYYRLKQINTDGNFVYSNIVALKNKMEEPVLKVLQNPFDNYVDVELPAKIKGAFIVQLIDASGKIVLKKNMQSDLSTFRLNIDKQLPKGVYVVSVIADNKIMSVQVVKK